MKTSISQDHGARVSFPSTVLAATVCVVLMMGQVSPSYAQRSMSANYFSFLAEVGIKVDGTFIPGIAVTSDQLATNPLIFENHSPDHLPVFMPDGTTQVRYNDLASVNGTATIRDVGPQGTEVRVRVDGLIPNGLYSTWIDFYRAPGFTPDLAHELGLTALGYDVNNPPADPQTYTGNVFTADASGRGEIVAIQPSVPPSWLSTGLVGDFLIPPYLLDSPVHQIFVALAYHQDGNTWGPRPGVGEGLAALDSTWVTYASSSFAIPEPSTSVLVSLGAVGILSCVRATRKRSAS